MFIVSIDFQLKSFTIDEVVTSGSRITLKFLNMFLHSKIYSRAVKHSELAQLKIF